MTPADKKLKIAVEALTQIRQGHISKREYIMPIRGKKARDIAEYTLKKIGEIK